MLPAYSFTQTQTHTTGRPSVNAAAYTTLLKQIEDLRKQGEKEAEFLNRHIHEDHAMRQTQADNRRDLDRAANNDAILQRCE